jgi:hypothetical protein
LEIEGYNFTLTKKNNELWNISSFTYIQSLNQDELQKYIRVLNKLHKEIDERNHPPLCHCGKIDDINHGVFTDNCIPF